MVISIHALLAESDRAGRRVRPVPTDFYPRSPCGERLNEARSILENLVISIHALLAESDVDERERVQGASTISIHALLAESDSKSAQNSGALLRI